jgi:hypothetical protein
MMVRVKALRKAMTDEGAAGSRYRRSINVISRMKSMMSVSTR